MKAVIYTRFSSTQQREASIEDQARNCRRRIDAEGFTLTAHFKDEAISGSIADRPGYVAMHKSAVAREFDVLVVDDLSRLSRDQVESERSIRRLEFGGVRIIGVSDGYDSQSKSRKVQRGVRGLMNEIYLDDLKDKTHRGLAGQALKKFWAGGKPYGYRLVQLKDTTRLDSYGNPEVIGTQLTVDEDQAAIVREIFTMYANDFSQRAIAAVLNERGVPSPGSSWRGRTVRRTTGWLGSTINALLPNELYRGRLHWNKSEWRKNPDTGRRTTRARPQSEWISHEMPELRVIDEALWARAIARRERAMARGANVRAALQARGHTGRGGPKYAFSGLLRCGLCGSSMVIVGGSDVWRAYGCAGHKDGGATVCVNSITVRRDILEARLLAPIKAELLSPAKLEDIQRRVAIKIAGKPNAKDNAPRMKQLRDQIGNLADAIAVGALKASPALAERLTTFEAELAHLNAQTAKSRCRVIDFPTKLAQRFNKLVDGLEQNLAREPHRARAALREICGEIPVFPHESGSYLVARLGLSDTLLRAAVGSEMFVVAGAGFVTYLQPCHANTQPSMNACDRAARSSSGPAALRGLPFGRSA
jgi:DNA invertase Pin-like site-specific DNA recombinase